MKDFLKRNNRPNKCIKRSCRQKPRQPGYAVVTWERTMQFEEKFLRINEETNAIDYLVKADSYIKEAETSDIAWKWVTIALHGALYGFAIAASSGTDSRDVTEKNGKRRRPYLHPGGTRSWNRPWSCIKMDKR